MPQTHKLVRDVVEAILKDDTNGFNAKLAAALPLYGVNEQIALNWDTAGVLYGRLASGDFRLTKLDGRLTLELAPDGSVYTGEMGGGVRWSGNVGLLMIFRVSYSYRDGDETALEDGVITVVATAVEDAVIEVFQGHRMWPDDLIYSRPPDCPEGYLLDPIDDGVEITIPMRVGFKVDAI
jgi:hypothetical protein